MGWPDAGLVQGDNRAAATRQPHPIQRPGSVRDGGESWVPSFSWSKRFLMACAATLALIGCNNVPFVPHSSYVHSARHRATLQAPPPLPFLSPSQLFAELARLPNVSWCVYGRASVLVKVKVLVALVDWSLSLSLSLSFVSRLSAFPSVLSRPCLCCCCCLVLVCFVSGLRDPLRVV
jgi:hypothetical protein